MVVTLTWTRSHTDYVKVNGSSDGMKDKSAWWKFPLFTWCSTCRYKSIVCYACTCKILSLLIPVNNQKSKGLINKKSSRKRCDFWYEMQKALLLLFLSISKNSNWFTINDEMLSSQPCHM